MYNRFTYYSYECFSTHCVNKVKILPSGHIKYPQLFITLNIEINEISKLYKFVKELKRLKIIELPKLEEIKCIKVCLDSYIFQDEGIFRNNNKVYIKLLPKVKCPSCDANNRPTNLVIAIGIKNTILFCNTTLCEFLFEQ